MAQDRFAWVCTNCDKSYPEDGFGLLKRLSLSGEKYYACSTCGQRVELHEIKHTSMPAGTIIHKGQQL